jgi:peptide/nickel transport system permease protein
LTEVEIFQATPEVPSEAPPDVDVEAQGLDEKPMTPGRLALRRFIRHRLAFGSLIVLLIISLFVIFAPVTARHAESEPLKTPVTAEIQNQAPSGDAWFGTDSIGLDVYSRVIWGGRVSIWIGIWVAIFSAAVGTVIGALAGYRGGWVDDILMRITDLFLAFPLLVALLVLRNVFANLEWLKFLFGELNSSRFVIVLLSCVAWMTVARIVRGSVLSLKEREFVEAARALGATDRRIMLRHLIPNSLGPIIVAMTTTVAVAIITESTLSFFGFGVSRAEGHASWGNLLADSEGVVQAGYWWLALFPALALVVTVLCINFIGDGLRDAFDPKQAKSRA